MPRFVIGPAVLALACLAAPGCDLFSKDENDPESPTAPSAPTVTLEGFAGTWMSTTASTPSTGCGTVRYTVTPLSASTATVSFSATCAGSIQVNGTGSGQVNGSTLDWTAQGLVGQGGVNCPFTFTHGKAVEDPGGIKVTYSGTVCGIPVSGSEVVKRS
jgi:hypothetical protein